MIQIQNTDRVPGTTYAISDTGPLISSFQSDSFSLLTGIFAGIRIPHACVVELERHGWEEEVQASCSKLIATELTPREEEQALAFVEQIVQHSVTSDPVVEHHIGEAQAIVLALRPEHAEDVLLLDELAARAVARQAELRLSGFPGVLLLATQAGLISAEELKVRLEVCRRKGTHYSRAFIQQVYEMAQRSRRQK